MYSRIPHKRFIDLRAGWMGWRTSALALAMRVHRLPVEAKGEGLVIQLHSGQELCQELVEA